MQFQDEEPNGVLSQEQMRKSGGRKDGNMGQDPNRETTAYDTDLNQFNNDRERPQPGGNYLFTN